MNINSINNLNRSQMGTIPNLSYAQVTNPISNNKSDGSFVSIYNTKSLNLGLHNVQFGIKTTAFNPLKGLAIDFLDRDGVPSAYSGHLTLTKRTFENYLTPEALSNTGRSAIKFLSGKKAPEGQEERIDFRKYMYETERACFNWMAEVSEIKPHATLNELCTELGEKSLPLLETDQLKVLDSMSELTEKLTPKHKYKVENIIQKARDIIDNHDIDNHFQKKPFINEIFRIKSKSHDNEALVALFDLAKTLPDSKTNVNAFFVKYARRDSTEIGRRLISPSIATFEHVVLRSKGGQKSTANGLIVSERDNQERGSLPYPKWIEEHQDLPTCLQRYMNYVVRTINKENRDDVYPKSIAETLFTESRGAISLDISRLKEKPIKPKKIFMSPTIKSKSTTKPQKTVKLTRKITNKTWKKREKKLEKLKDAGVLLNIRLNNLGNPW